MDWLCDRRLDHEDDLLARAEAETALGPVGRADQKTRDPGAFSGVLRAIGQDAYPDGLAQPDRVAMSLDNAVDLQSTPMIGEAGG